MNGNYSPIEDYALLSNSLGTALVSSQGSIDWACFERFDAAPTFSRIIDAERGGYFSISPTCEHRITRRYIPRTNVLQTIYRTAKGVVSLTDFMVMPDSRWASGAHLVRVVRCVAGRVALRVRYRPLAGFADAFAPLRVENGCVMSEASPTLISDRHWTIEEGTASYDEEIAADTVWRFAIVPYGTTFDLDEVVKAYDETVLYWENWAAGSLYQGSREDEVIRSALVLRGLTCSQSGAVIAAATTSLPEEIGGVRNWDYRYCWIRDACLSYYALFKFGTSAESEAFFDFMARLLAQDGGHLKPLYAIDGSTHKETEVAHFEGYRASKPVRTGNGASDQTQLDIYGQMFDLVYLQHTVGGSRNDGIQEACRAVADMIASRWDKPDDGLWEPRCEPKFYVHSAIMNWVVLDRAVRLFGERDHWVEARDAIAAKVNSEGVHPERGCLTQVFGEDAVDASLLIAPMVDFPVDRGVFEKTVDAIIEDLAEGSLVYRYKTPDGLPGEEGTFLICAFWLVDALAWLGRGEEALRRYEQLRALMNDVGLYPEEISREGQFLGNFPQAFSHLSFIHSTFVLDLYREGGAAFTAGTYADRAMRETKFRSAPEIAEHETEMEVA